MKKSDVSRRSFVQAGVLGMGGLNLAELLRLKAQATRPSSIRPGRKTSVILFWLSGGPGHMAVSYTHLTLPKKA